MSRFTQQDIDVIREIAHTTGRCSECHQSVAVNTYGISPTMVETLKQMARITSRQLEELGDREVDVRATSLDHNHRSSLSKLRQHGLITKHLGDNGKQVAGHWLITKKGWQFLSGASVEEYVEVYDNTVIGHPGGTITKSAIEKADKLANDPDLIEHKKITTAEAASLDNLRGDMKAGQRVHVADYQGNGMKGLAKGETVDIMISPLRHGKPIYVIYNSPEQGAIEFNYKDVSAFMRDWKILK